MLNQETVTQMYVKLTKVILAFVIALGALTFSAGNADAQALKIGFVDAEKIMQNYEAWRKAEEQFQTEYRAWEGEYDKMLRSYVDDSLEFQKKKLILSAERKTEWQAEVGAKRLAAESFAKDILGPNGQAERKRSNLMKPLLDNLNAAINKVATEGNYDAILNPEALAYANPSLDITDKVIAALAEEG
jgi:Skp family chaperone for outer membrane proteins